MRSRASSSSQSHRIIHDPRHYPAQAREGNARSKWCEHPLSLAPWSPPSPPCCRPLRRAVWRDAATAIFILPSCVFPFFFSFGVRLRVFLLRFFFLFCFCSLSRWDLVFLLCFVLRFVLWLGCETVCVLRYFTPSLSVLLFVFSFFFSSFFPQRHFRRAKKDFGREVNTSPNPIPPNHKQNQTLPCHRESTKPNKQTDKRNKSSRTNPPPI